MTQIKKSTSVESYTYKVLFTSLVLDLLGFTLILPLIPSLLDHYSKHDQSGLYSYLESFISKYSNWIQSPNEYQKVFFGGLLGSWFSLLQFSISPFVGSVSDTLGRKIPLVTCLLGVTCAYLCWLLSSYSFALFVISRTIAGLSKGNVTLSTAIVADVSTEGNRGKGMALIGMAFSAGFIIGPIMGATFAIYSKSLSTQESPSSSFFLPPAAVSLTLSLINVLFVIVYFQESLPLENRVKSLGKGLKQAFEYVNPVALFSFRSITGSSNDDLKILRKTGWIYFHFLFIYSGLEYTLCFLTHLRFNYSSIQQGKLYLFVGLIMALFQGGIVRRIKPKSEPMACILGISIMIPSFILIGSASGLIQLYFGLGLYSISSSVVVPCLTTLASNHGPREQKGSILGIFRSLGALARSFGPVISSTVFWKFGPTNCYLIGSLLMILPLTQVIQLRRQLLEKKESGFKNGFESKKESENGIVRTKEE